MRQVGIKRRPLEAEVVAILSFCKPQMYVEKTHDYYFSSNLTRKLGFKTKAQRVAVLSSTPIGPPAKPRLTYSNVWSCNRGDNILDLKYTCNTPSALQFTLLQCNLILLPIMSNEGTCHSTLSRVTYLMRSDQEAKRLSR